MADGKKIFIAEDNHHFCELYKMALGAEGYEVHFAYNGKEALDKIRRKNYGLCEKCGEPVGEKRLEALPFAKLCIRCQEEEERR